MEWRTSGRNQTLRRGDACGGYGTGEKVFGRLRGVNFGFSERLGLDQGRRGSRPYQVRSISDGNRSRDRIRRRSDRPQSASGPIRASY